MTRGRTQLLAAALTALLLVAVGRWEADRHVDLEIDGMHRVLAAVGPLGNQSLDAYRVSLVPFDCLLYRRGANPYALELCADERGRLVEALDRRSGTLKVSSLREDPDASTIHIDRAEFNRLLRRLGVPKNVNAGPRGQ